MKNRKSLLVAGLVLGLSGMAAMAGTDVSAITDAATTTWTAVATLCVTIGTFIIGYRLARKVR